MKLKENNMPGIKKDGTPKKAPVRRSPIVVLQILDEAGDPMEFPKSRIRTVATTPDAEQALSLMESGRYPHAIFVRAPANGNTK
jgi:hypothetical protein